MINACSTVSSAVRQFTRLSGLALRGSCERQQPIILHEDFPWRQHRADVGDHIDFGLGSVPEPYLRRLATVEHVFPADDLHPQLPLDDQAIEISFETETRQGCG